MIFKKNEFIEFDDGSSAKVVDVVGSGGQGKVYKVEIDKKFFAVKLYHPSFANSAKRFKKNLKENIEKGPVSNKFIWPLKLTKTYEDGSFGYLMDLIPDDYQSFTKLITSIKMGKAPDDYYFHGAAVTACRIVFEFRKLWKRGKCFQDLNEGSIFVNPSNWDVLICDCDNVAGDRTDIFVQGMPRYMAPEIVLGKDKPNYYTDLHSIAVLIFMLLFGGMHPFEGKESRRLTFEDSKNSSLLTYGESAIYVMDPNNDKNRPQSGIDTLFLTLFPFYPQYVKDLFAKMFIEGTKSNKKRPNDKDILVMLGRLLNNIIVCPYCKRPFIPDLDKNGLEEKCSYSNCGKTIKVPLYLENKYTRVFVIDKQCIYKWHLDSSHPEASDSFDVVGVVIKNDDNSYKIKNVSELEWVLSYHGKTAIVPKDKTVAIKYDAEYKLSINKIDFIVK